MSTQAPCWPCSRRPTGRARPRRPETPGKWKEADVAGPSWLSDTFAAVMLLIAVYCAARLAVAAAWRRETELDTDVVHLLMGVAMAGTLAPALSFAPSAVW